MPELTKITFKHKSVKNCHVRFIKKSNNYGKAVICEPSGSIPFTSVKGNLDFLIDACSNCQIPEELKPEKNVAFILYM